MTPPRDWANRAACRDADPTLFDPLNAQELYRARKSRFRQTMDPMRLERLQVAATYCASCPVVAECIASRSLHTDSEQVGYYGAQYVDFAEARRRLSSARQLRRALEVVAIAKAEVA